MSEIIIVRHGETEWNVAEVFRGRIDVELNQTGIRQAELLGQYMSKSKIEAVYSSPLKRALRTAEAIAGHHRLEVETTPALIDLDFGKWQGLPRTEVETKYKASYDDWMNHPERLKMPEGESLNAVTERVLGVVNEAAARHKGTVVLVSHRVVNKVIICALLGLDNSHFWNIALDTCGLSTFTHQNGRFILNEHNNTSFLRPLNKPRLSDF